jgi:Fe-S oxidoreductase
MGIEPQVLADERCCGHDLLWEGDAESFQRLAKLNAALIRKSGVRRIVTSCPECARALKIDYPVHGIELDAEVLHLSELLTKGKRANGQMVNERGSARNTEHAACVPGLRVTYQDPCRLGRHMGIYDAPRQVIEGLGVELLEMPRNRENAFCCGTNGWTHCGAANRQIQGDRLWEAQSTGAEILVTACLKCQIHLRCAMQDRQLAEEITIEVKDLATLVAERINDGVETVFVQT